MTGSNNPCPNCTYNTLNWSKKRKTFRCWTCGYEAETSGPVPSKMAPSEVRKLLDPDSSYPKTLTGNERATIMEYIRDTKRESNQQDPVTN